MAVMTVVYYNDNDIIAVMTCYDDVMTPHEVPSPAGSARLAVHHPHGGEVARGGERLQAHLLYLLHPAWELVGWLSW